MPTKPVCRQTHPLIASGVCRWCDQPVVDGEPRPELPPQEVAPFRWNIPAMLDALDSPDAGVRSNVPSSLLFECPDVEQAIPVLRKALQGEHMEVFLALSALNRVGHRLTPEEAETWEKQAATHPEEAVVRLLLLGYYMLPATSDPAARQARQRHVLWVIEHTPHLCITGCPDLQLDPAQYGEAYDQAKQIWLRHLAAEENDLTLLANAAQFFRFHDAALGLTLLQKAEALEPGNPEWPRRLGRLRSIQRQRLGAREPHEYAVQRFADYERAYALERGELERFRLLPDLAMAAYAAGAWDKAHGYAEEALHLAERPDYFYHKDGAAVHAGHLVLGRLALRAGDVETAKQHLLEQSQLKDTPYLCTFGPNMALAKELLDQGERGVVVSFLRLCTQFWKPPDNRGEGWLAALERGELPEFGRNLWG